MLHILNLFLFVVLPLVGVVLICSGYIGQSHSDLLRWEKIQEQDVIGSAFNSQCDSKSLQNTHAGYSACMFNSVDTIV